MPEGFVPILVGLYLLIGVSYAIIAFALVWLRSYLTAPSLALLMALSFGLRAASIVGTVALPYIAGLSYVVVAVQIVSSAVTFTLAWKMVDLIRSVEASRRVLGERDDP